MKVISIICRSLEKYMALLIILLAIFALYFPKYCTWVQISWMPFSLMIIMFCMGLTQSVTDFYIMLKHPKEIIIGCLAQFIIMPSLAFLLTVFFDIDEALAVGVILVGCAPGGTASNVITYLSKGDVTFSIGMTCATTLISPIITPCLVWCFIHKYVAVDIVSMFLSIVQIIILPIAAGLFFQSRWKNVVQKIVPFLPLCSFIPLLLMLVAVISHNSLLIRSMGAMIFTLVAIQNLGGYALGFLVGWILRMPLSKKKALSIEVGMQNAGLAVNLAAQNFAYLPLAAVPGAVFSIWHLTSGTLLANFFAAKK